MIFQLPERMPFKLVETELMREIAARTLVVHPQGGFVMWSGKSRNGKTVAARWLRDGLNGMPDSDERAFKAVHFEVSRSSRARTPGDEAKRAIRRTWNAIVGPLPAGRSRNAPEDIARDLVQVLQARRIEMILIDEAGGLTLNDIRGLMTLGNVAANLAHRLTIVLIGMDELPLLIEELAQVRERVAEACYFEPYGQEDCMKFLTEMLPYFEAARQGDIRVLAEAQYLIDLAEGLPGKLASYCTRIRGHLIDRGREITLENLQMVHLIKEHDTARAKALSSGRTNNRTRVEKPTAPKAVIEKSGPARKRLPGRDA